MSKVDLDAFRAIQAVALDLGLEVVLVGALARQIIFDEQVLGEPYRATLDTDAVVRVVDWNQFNLLISNLADNGFTPVSDKHLKYTDGSEVDLLPFGGVEDAAGNLTRSGERTISLRGVDSAVQSAEQIDSKGVEVRVVNLPGLMVLKLVSFQDRHSWERKDLADMVFILERATDYFGSEPYRYMDGQLLAEFEYDQVGPYYLGMRVASISKSPEVREQLGILEELILAGPLYRELTMVSGEKVESAVTLFEAFKAGLEAHRK